MKLASSFAVQEFISRMPSTGFHFLNRQTPLSSVAVVGHVHATGPVQALEDFFSQRVQDFAFVGHPFYSKKSLPSHLRLYGGGQVNLTKLSFALRGPESVLYLKDFLVTIAFFLRLKRRFSLYVGVDALNAVAGLVLRKLGLVESVVFYTIDLVPRRFKNPFLNRAYHLFDQIAAQRSTYVWNLSPAMAELRKRLGNPSHLLSPQIVVPIGVNFEGTSRQPLEQVDRRCLVYIGTLRKGQGLDLIFRTFPKMLGRIPDLKLVVIGEGPMRRDLEKTAVMSSLGDRIHLLGFIPDHRQAEAIISKCGIGLAPYEPGDTLAKYTEPSKPKTYMACGLPVIITRVPRVASDIEKAGAGIAIDYDEEQFMQAVARLALDHIEFDKCRENALEFVSRFDWASIYSEALEKCNLQCPTK